MAPEPVVPHSSRHGGAVLAGIWLDVLLAIRAARARPLLFSVIVITLGLSLGANTAIFSLISTVLLRELPVKNPERLVILSDTDRDSPAWNGALWEQIRDRQGLFAGAMAWSPDEFNLSTGNDGRAIDGVWASGTFFEVLGVGPTLGRVLTRDDDQRLGGPQGPVAVVSHRFWRSHFGGGADAIGHTLVLDSVAFTVVGVTPPSFFGPDVGRQFDVVLPLSTEPLVRGANSSLDRAGRFWLRIMARLRPDQTVAGVTAALRGIQPELRAAVIARGGPVPPGFLKSPLELENAAQGRSQLRDQFGGPLVLLMLIAAAVMLIACMNIANLLLSRAIALRPQVSVRLALGSSRLRVARLQFVEALLVAACGSLLGLSLSGAIGQVVLRRLSWRGAAVYLDLTPDWRVFVFAALAAIGTTLLFGVVPSWYLMRADPGAALQEQGRGSVHGGRSRLLACFVAVQIAVSFVLVAAAGLFVRTLAAVQEVGFSSERVLLVTVGAGAHRRPPEQLAPIYERVREAVEALPGVAQVALSDLTPLSNSSRMTPVTIPGSSAAAELDRTSYINVVSPDWFSVYGLPVLQGRDFTAADHLKAPHVAVVNRAFVQHFFQSESAVGRTVTVGQGGSAETLEVIGVVGNAAYESARDPHPPTIFLSTAQRPVARPTINLSVLADRDTPEPLTRSVSTAIGEVDSSLVLRFKTLQQQVDEATSQERLVAALSALFGGLALLLGAIGLFGVTAYGVSRRRTELALRISLGAARPAIVGLILQGVVLPVLIGIVAGMALTLGASKFLTALVWGVTPQDPVTLLVTAAILVGIGFVGGGLPAWHASRVDPARILQQ
jgi:predicted permease